MRGVGTREAHVRTPPQLDALDARRPVATGRPARHLRTGGELRGGRGVACRVERALDRLAPDCAAARQADAIRRKHAGQRMQQHFLDPERVGDRTCVLPGGAAETQQRMAAGSSPRCNASSRIAFAMRATRHAQVRIGQRLDRVVEHPSAVAQRAGEFLQALARCARLSIAGVAARAEHSRKTCRRNSARARRCNR